MLRQVVLLCFIFHLFVSPIFYKNCIYLKYVYYLKEVYYSLKEGNRNSSSDSIIIV
jgi:hypothetical protein